jgi:NADPH-dependent 2,4-dienoyl-CoA reductase/sulfur reductase-like enzyme
MKHVIIGAGPAGVIAAETLRKLAPHDDITLIGDEPEAPYSRMAIPYLLMGKVGERGTYLRQERDPLRDCASRCAQAKVVWCKRAKTVAARTAKRWSTTSC